jgi:hypothetical protein
MKESIELRIADRYASNFFSAEEGRRIGPLREVRIVSIDTKDPRLGELAKMNRKIWAKGRILITGWKFIRRYTKSELAQAKCLQLLFTSYFEPAGEECGTVYDEATACSKCGAGARQTSALGLQINSIPKSKDVAVTIGGEIVASLKLKELFQSRKVTGAGFGPVVARRRGADVVAGNWFQFLAKNSSAEIMTCTRTGVDPFGTQSPDPHICSRGDTIGLNLLSEVTLDKRTIPADDVFSSRQYLGNRMGLLRPYRPIFVSQKVREIVETHDLKGIKFEIAHLL